MDETVARRWMGRVLILVLVVGAPLLITGCSGRKISTSVQDQITVVSKKQIEERRAVPETVPPEVPPALFSEVNPPEPQAAPLPEEVQGDMTAAAPSLTGKEEAETVVVPPPMEAAPAELDDVYFDFDKFTIRSDAKMILEANADRLREYTDGIVVIEGHCDERGSADYNLLLGERRALAVKRHLQELGISGARLSTTTYGKERPFCTQRTDACWQKNRRAHLELKQR